MICSTCRRAGELNADAYRVHDANTANSLLFRSAESHTRCDGCDCRHRVGKWLVDVTSNT